MRYRSLPLAQLLRVRCVPKVDVEWHVPRVPQAAASRSERRADAKGMGNVRSADSLLFVSHREVPLPIEFARLLRSELKCPMMKTKNVSSADTAGEEKQEKRSATPVRIISST